MLSAARPKGRVESRISRATRESAQAAEPAALIFVPEYLFVEDKRVKVLFVTSEVRGAALSIAACRSLADQQDPANAKMLRGIIRPAGAQCRCFWRALLIGIP